MTTLIKEDLQQIKQADVDHPIHKLLASRWSPRMFSSRPVEEEELHKLFEASRWAASSYNQQPWRFIYGFKGTKAYDRIHDCLVKFNRKWTVNAPVLVLTAYKEKFDSGKDNQHALHDLGLAVGNMTLQATSMGIALHSMAGLDQEKAEKEFDVPEGFHISTAIAIGYYGGDTSSLPDDLEETEIKERERMPQEEFAWEGEWSDE